MTQADERPKPRALLRPEDSLAYHAELEMAQRKVKQALRLVNQDYTVFGEVERTHHRLLEDARNYLYNRFGVAA